jgi:hypothetical protein
VELAKDASFIGYASKNYLGATVPVAGATVSSFIRAHLADGAVGNVITAQATSAPSYLVSIFSVNYQFLYKHKGRITVAYQ